MHSSLHSLFLKFYLFIYLLIFGCAGSLLLLMGFLQLRRAGAALGYSAWASHCSGFSCCVARALGAWASVVVAHVGSSRTRARTRVPCLGRRILSHCATREAPLCILYTSGDFAPEGDLQDLETFLVGTGQVREAVGRCCYGVQGVEVRDADKQPTTHRTIPTAE